MIVSRGWRERVTAAKVICAFRLEEFVAPLVETFPAGPETYTASAFSSMLSSVRTPENDRLLAVLRDACPSTNYGKYLLEVIEKAAIA
ncbi:hypothetical protein D3C87_1854500 [compost metagenome]